MKILFVCRANSRRSQAAAAIFNKLSKKHTATSAGLDVALEGREGQPIKEDNIAIMKTMGYDISDATRRQLTEKLVDDADCVVWMLEKERVPKYLAGSSKLVYMQIENPKGMDGIMRKTNLSKVEAKVKEFAATLG